MPRVGNTWSDWAATERDANSPIDAIFTRKWNDRDAQIQIRGERPYKETGQLATSTTVQDWMPIRTPEGLGTRGRIFVPPGATHLYIDLSIAIEVTSPSTLFASVHMVPNVGAAAGSFMAVILCDDPFFCDGTTDGDDGVFFRKSSIVVLAAADRGKEVDFYYQAIGDANTTSATIATPYPWVWTKE